jgi:hypothetical protein
MQMQVYQSSHMSEDDMIKMAQRLGLIQYIPIVRWSAEHVTSDNQEYVQRCDACRAAWGFSCHAAVGGWRVV